MHDLLSQLPMRLFVQTAAVCAAIWISRHCARTAVRLWDAGERERAADFAALAVLAAMLLSS
jgi:hypothetical protein